MINFRAYQWAVFSILIASLPVSMEFQGRCALVLFAYILCVFEARFGGVFDSMTPEIAAYIAAPLPPFRPWQPASGYRPHPLAAAIYKPNPPQGGSGVPKL